MAGMATNYVRAPHRGKLNVDGYVRNRPRRPAWKFFAMATAEEWQKLRKRWSGADYGLRGACG